MVSGAQPPTDIKMRAGSYTNKIGACARGKGLTFADAPASRLASISLNLDALEPIKKNDPKIAWVVKIVKPAGLTIFHDLVEGRRIPKSTEEKKRIPKNSEDGAKNRR